MEPAHSGLEQRLRLDEAVAALGAGVGGVGGEEEHGSVELGGGAQEAMGLLLLRLTGGVVEEEGAWYVGVPLFDERGSISNALLDKRGGERAAVVRRRREGMALAWRRARWGGGGEGARHRWTRTRPATQLQQQAKAIDGSSIDRS